MWILSPFGKFRANTLGSVRAKHGPRRAWATIGESGWTMMSPPRRIGSQPLARLKRAVRRLSIRARGLTPGQLTHEEIARRIGRPDPTILEIGCNDGSDTLKFLRVMPRARIYCFEPDPRAIRRFNKQVGLQRDNVTLFEIALSDRTGTIEFHQSSGGDTPGGWDLSGSIRRPKNHLVEHPWVEFND